MKKKLTAMLPYLLVLAADFYLLPFLARDTGTAMLLMLCVMPFAALGTAAAYGMRRGFDLLLPIGSAVLFLPTVFLYYNASAWVYSAGYGVVTLVGMAVGRIFYGKR